MESKWQKEMREGFRNLGSLLDFLRLPHQNDYFHPQSQDFMFRVPFSFASRMEKENPSDPLLLQVLPLQLEHEKSVQTKKDAVGDLQSIRQKGMIQKYQGRVLIITTGACAIHCRYCFRRNFPYAQQNLDHNTKIDILSTLESDPSIEEVIFSGGDPLLLGDEVLAEWSQALTKISHIKRWRFHTRLPSVLPSRITRQLIEVFEEYQSQDRKVIIVSHINHPNEINQEVSAKLQMLQNASLILLNQSVLLKGINDNSKVLKTLGDLLFNNGVLPYYLHLLDRTEGVMHFEVSEKEALRIYHELASNTPGYLLPKLVREIEGQPYKVRI